MKLIKFKYGLLFFFISFYSVAQRSPSDVPTLLEKIGMDVRMLKKIKSKSLKAGGSYLLREVPEIKGLKFKEIRTVWKHDSLQSLTCLLDSTNGSQLLRLFIKEYGTPSSSGVLDINEWFTDRHSLSLSKQEENMLFNCKKIPFTRNRKYQEEFNWDKLTD